MKSIVTGLLKILDRDFNLVEEVDHGNGFVQKKYSYAGEDYTVDCFEGKAHCVINETARTQYTRSGTTRFKA